MTYAKALDNYGGETRRELAQLQVGADVPEAHLPLS